MTGKIHQNDQDTSGEFIFSEANLVQAKAIIARYPDGKQRSAMMPLLTLAQKQNGNWLSRAAMETVADMIDVPVVRVYEVASFYTMYNLKPMGKHHIQVCTTTPCWLRGSDEIVGSCKKKLGIGVGETTADGQFTLGEAECLGACVNAPMVQVTTAEFSEYYEDLTPQTMSRLLEALERGERPKAGPQSKRISSEPLTGATTLKTGAGGDK